MHVCLYLLLHFCCYFVRFSILFVSSAWGILAFTICWWKAKQMSPFHDFIANVVIFVLFKTIVFFMYLLILIRFWNVFAVLLTIDARLWPVKNVSLFEFCLIRTRKCTFKQQQQQQKNVIILWYSIANTKQQLEHMMFNCADFSQHNLFGILAQFMTRDTFILFLL